MIEIIIKFDEREPDVLIFSTKTRGANETAREWIATRSAQAAVKLWWSLYVKQSGAEAGCTINWDPPADDATTEAAQVQALACLKARKRKPAP